MFIDTSVFISYRRTSFFTAQAVYQYLTAQGFVAFLNHDTFRSGSYEYIIFDQILACSHFVVILTPSSLKRCHEPDDWLRKEIEWAVENERNIVPLFFDGFDFADFDRYLTGRLGILGEYEPVCVPTEFFAEAMQQLCDEYLKHSLDVATYPLSRAAQLIANAQKARVNRYPTVTMRQLNAEEYFERGAQRQLENDIKGAIRDYSRALQFHPYYAESYNNRGVMFSVCGYMKRAIADYSQAIHINARYSAAYCNRGFELAKYGYYADAITDYSQALKINPKDATAYHGRGQVYYRQGDLDKALADYNNAIVYDPTLARAYNDRGIIWFKQGNYDLSRSDFDRSIALNPDDLTVYMNRAQVCDKQGNIRQAINDYEIALILNPDLDAVHKHLKRLYQIRRQLQGKLPQ